MFGKTPLTPVHTHIESTGVCSFPCPASPSRPAHLRGADRLAWPCSCHHGHALLVDAPRPRTPMTFQWMAVEMGQTSGITRPIRAVPMQCIELQTVSKKTVKMCGFWEKLFLIKNHSAKEVGTAEWTNREIMERLYVGGPIHLIGVTHQSLEPDGLPIDPVLHVAERSPQSRCDSQGAETPF